MTFDPTTFAHTFIANLRLQQSDPEGADRCKALNQTLTSITYGYFQLWYGVARDAAFQQAARDRTLDGAVQVVEENGELRLWEGRESEPEGTIPQLRPYKRPGTGNQKDREGNLITRSEFDADVLWVGLYRPLWIALKEQFDQSYFSKLKSLESLFQQYGIKGTAEQLEFLINEILDEAIAYFGESTIRGVRVLDRAKRSGETFDELSREDKRMRMRGLLITLNEEALERRRNRKGNLPEKRADTVAGQVYRSYQAPRANTSRPVARPQLRQQPPNPVPAGGHASNGHQPSVPTNFFQPYGGTRKASAAPGSRPPGAPAPGATPPGASAPGSTTIIGVRQFDYRLLDSLPPEELEPIPQGGVEFYGSLTDLEEMEEREGVIY